MRHISGLFCLLFFLPVAALANNDCSGPVTGMIAHSNFHFTYESWRKLSETSGSLPRHRFERCLYNAHEQALWFDWKRTGLENRIVAGGDKAVIFFDEYGDDKHETHKDLWYGPIPVKVDARTVLHPREVALPKPRLWLAQDRSGPTPADIFRDPQSLAAELELVGPAGILRSSGTKVTVPADADIGERVRRGEGNVSNGDLLGVWIVLREQVFLGSAGPESRIAIIIDAAAADYDEFVERGNDPPVLQIDTEVRELHSRLPGLGSEIELSRDSPFSVAVDSIRLVLAEDGSVPLERAHVPAEGAIVATFGKADAFATFPVTLSRYAGSL